MNVSKTHKSRYFLLQQVCINLWTVHYFEAKNPKLDYNVDALFLPHAV